MKMKLLNGLSLAGLCWMAMSVSTVALAQAPCPTCPQQSCPTCPGYARTNCHHESCLCPIVKWAVCPNYYILPPDYGWTAPAKVPVVRQGVTYYRYYPEQWYGTGNSNTVPHRTYQSVYQPTDTTQLGYTYQQVPYWQPAPYRLPPPPVPSQWHVREANHGYRGRWHDQYTPIHHHQQSTYWIEPLRANATMPAPVNMAPAQAAPCPPAPQPAAPLQAVPQKLEPEPASPMPPAPAPASEPKTAKKSFGSSLSAFVIRKN